MTIDYYTYGPLIIHRAVFQKTNTERAAVKKAKLNHHNRLRKFGYNRKKRMNVPTSNGRPIPYSEYLKTLKK